MADQHFGGEAVITLPIVVEGETEEVFVNHLLDAHLRMAGIECEPILLKGDVSVSRLATFMGLSFRQHGRVTSLVDYYGFLDKGTDGVATLEQRILTTVQDRLGQPADPSLIIPYVQQYEFEALLFSQVSAFRDVFGLYQGTLDQLLAIRQQFANPEEINDHPDTAPSKRILRVVTNYIKVAHGPAVAQAIGLPAIRAQCPRFNQWLAHLESLSA